MLKTLDVKQFVIWTLRKGSYRWFPRNACLRKAVLTKEEYATKPGEKVSKLVRNFYQCAGCKKGFSRKGVSLDHIRPVIDPKTGWRGFDEYVKRMFCDEGGFQVICKLCHNAKTKKENNVRSRVKKRGK